MNDERTSPNGLKFHQKRISRGRYNHTTEVDGFVTMVRVCHSSSCIPFPLLWCLYVKLCSVKVGTKKQQMQNKNKPDLTVLKKKYISIVLKIFFEISYSFARRWKRIRQLEWKRDVQFNRLFILMFFIFDLCS